KRLALLRASPLRKAIPNTKPSYPPMKTPMKKSSTNQSVPVCRYLGEGGFFNLRAVISVFIILFGAFLALAGSGVLSAPAASSAKGQQKYSSAINSNVFGALPLGFDCSTIHEKGIDKQDNMRAGAIMIACGLSEGGSPSKGSQFSGNGFSQWIKNLLPAPLFIGGTDVDVVLPDSAYPKVT